MRILSGENWKKGYLDYGMCSGQVRVQVGRMANIQEVEGEYVEYSTSDWRKVWNYIREVGVKTTLRKVWSRLRERVRNDRWLSVGTGRVVEVGEEVSLNKGASVAFAACHHSRCADRIVVDSRFVVVCESAGVENGLSFFDSSSAPDAPAPLRKYAGWEPESGWPVDEETLTSTIRNVTSQLCELAPTRSLGRDVNRTTIERKEKELPEAQYTSTLFGLGNYAKTVILPNLPGDIQLSCIHELDPTQIGDPSDWNCSVDTASHIRSEEQSDIYLIAGYHHTHAPLAIDALDRGAVAVVEKPISTTRPQLQSLRRALQSNRKLYSCFHKRYSPLNKWLRSDLRVSPPDPIHYHCIVYEIPLPPLHWYNWPSSGSRIVSNGCHWLDHFQFLNGYAPVREFFVREAAEGGIVVTVELENDALFTMSLTEKGSKRLGVRDHVEIRAGGVTAYMIDNSRYKAEDDSRVLREESVNRMDSYANMYREIGHAIMSGGNGDRVESLRSTELMLDIENRLQAQTPTTSTS
ncbi:Gfo/Idh/MocA family protein [Salinibacter ruber]|uniref:Gfo/Idh/MocA family protein n=1 Tax=Salinibacter ruber TaxID=146919 RepID=UPI0024520725|nr:putative dehydrogenase [Salinibacter ruber]